jgi:sugar/nucleoside kinase (ribokinase family)
MISSRKLTFNPKYIIAGSLSRDFVIPSNSIPKLDFLGGNAAYTAAGLALWDRPVGIITRIGEDFPREWLNKFTDYEIDIRGVKIFPESLDLRNFYGYNSDGTFQIHSPVGLFADLELPFPPSLYNYMAKKTLKDDLHSRVPTSPISSDIPADYLDAIAAHLCPMDYITQSLLQSALHSGEIRTITLEANPAYLIPENWKLLPNIVSGLTCFIVMEEDIRQFFRGRCDALPEIAAGLGAMGCELVVIRLKDGGKFLYQHSNKKKWLVPDYPVTRINAHSSYHAFCGGFLSGYILSYDPVTAVLHGCVSESIASQGLHPLSIFDAIPGLAQVRLEILKEQVHIL